MRNDRLTALVVTLATLAIAPSAAIAQVAWESPLLIHPPPAPRAPIRSQFMETLITPLEPGAAYAVETIDVTGDPVITVLTAPGTSGDVLGGADGLDGCYEGSPVVKEACARFVADDTSVYVFARAWSNALSGRLTLRVRRLTSIDEPLDRELDDIACPVPTPVYTTGCWITVTASEAAFGGSIRSGVGTPAVRYNFVTRETTSSFSPRLPPAHTIWFAGPNNDTSSNWNLLASSTALPTNGVAQTAQHVGPLPPGVTIRSTIFAGVYASAWATGVVLQRNDYVPGTPGSPDFDGDGLGPALERIHRICDSPDTVSPPGFTCDVSECALAPAVLTDQCRAFLNDSDRDAIPDPVDLYGDVSNSTRHMRLGRMGTSPAQYDVLVEVDPLNDDPLNPAGVCTLSEWAVVDWREALQAANLFQDSRGRVPNRNGTEGIRMHFDIPDITIPGALRSGDSIAGPPTGNNPGYGTGEVTIPAEQDSRYGYWGGASCAREPLCSEGCRPFRSCVMSRRGFCDNSPGAMCASSAVCPPGGNCVTEPDYCEISARQEYMHPARRWLFRHNRSFSDGPGSTGAGGTADGALTGSSGDVPMAHELSHQGGLQHGTPLPQFDDSTNGRPNHYSHVNYLFQNYGIVQTINVGSATVPRPPPLRLDILRQISFSDGRLPALDPYAVAEYCPFGPAADYRPLFSNVSDFANGIFTTGTNHNWEVTPTLDGCFTVDWDGDGRTVLPGQTLESRLWTASKERIRRLADATEVVYALDQAPVLLRQAPDQLCIYRLDRLGQGGDAITQACAGPFACPHSPTPGTAMLSRWPTCDMGASTASALPVLGPDNLPVRPNGAFGAALSRRSDGRDVVVLVWREGPTTLRWGVLASGRRLEAVGTIPGTNVTSFPVTSGSTGAQLFGFSALASGSALLVYERFPDGVFEQVMTWSGTTPVWSATPTPVLSGTSYGPPGLTSFVPGTFASVRGFRGAVMAVRNRMQNGPPLLEIWTRDARPARPVWTLWDSLSLPEGSAGDVRGQPQLAVSTTRRGVAPAQRQDHLWISIVGGSNNRGLLFRSDPETLGAFEDSELWMEMNGTEQWVVASAPAMRWDDRQTAGLRGVITQFQASNTCGTDADCASDENCVSYGPNNLCMLSGGRFARLFEWRSIGIDGVNPGILESINEWPTMLRTYCRTLRRERTRAPAPWSGESLLGGVTCPVAPTF